MNVKIWDVAGDIERLVQSAHPACTDDLAKPGVALTGLLQRLAGRHTTDNALAVM